MNCFTDSAVIEKECIYVLFVDPDTFEPTMSLFSLKDIPSQDAVGIEASIRAAFKEHGLENLIDQMVFLTSDRASINSSLKNGLILKVLRNRDELGGFHLVLITSPRTRIKR